MQTFLPCQSFHESALCLDYKRLGKQRVECLQLLHVLTGVKSGWANHPAAKMWRGHEYALGCYGLEICSTWRERGYKDTCFDKIYSIVKTLDNNQKWPGWLGYPDFHASHRSNLLRKDPVHYGKFGWTEPADLPYIWPV